VCGAACRNPRHAGGSASEFLGASVPRVPRRSSEFLGSSEWIDRKLLGATPRNSELRRGTRGTRGTPREPEEPVERADRAARARLVILRPNAAVRLGTVIAEGSPSLVRCSPHSTQPPHECAAFLACGMRSFGYCMVQQNCCTAPSNDTPSCHHHNRAVCVLKGWPRLCQPTHPAVPGSG
jgi:hypothetical protein